ncbi:oxidoreductase [Amycolatopsis taiwanensis]|uniref:Oxidoreductase n=1 Tax=Amycolatopsis taiwanensis TaxID=342230 RepID=A0A9W6QX21_9PSEU|nr:oxidoreductase [Amycolatopsis taiwanensis]
MIFGYNGSVVALGAVFRPQSPPEQLRDVAVAADESGLEQLWLWEDCFFESGIASAAAVLAWTRRLRVGIGVLPVPLRNVALTAMETATLDRMFPGRFMLGLGHGVQDWMGQVGARAGSPLTLLREQFTAIRALLRGERVTTDGRYVKLDDVALGWPPSTAPAVFAAAGGPRTLRLVGEVADGTILDERNSPDTVRRAVELIDAGRAAAGRTDHHEVVSYLNAATGPDGPDRLRAELESRGQAPNSEVGVAGDAEAVAKAVLRLVNAGAGTVVLVPTADEPDPAGFVRFVAEKVRPLVP